VGKRREKVQGVLKPKIDVKPGLKSLKAPRMMLYLNREFGVAA
jgi:hypothetical protein